MKYKEKTFISAVVYIHNAENRLGRFLKNIIQELEENFEHSEIICINDFSGDNSLNVIKEVGLLTKFVSITVINMSYFHGLELAMNAGVDMAIGDFVFEFDNTYLDFDSEMLMKIYQHALKGFDIVSASSDRREKFSSRIFYSVFGKSMYCENKMVTESFRILSRRAINRVHSINNTISYRKAAYQNSGLRTDNLRYTAIDLDTPINDKKERRYRTMLAVDTIVLFTDLGYKFSISMTALMMFVSVFMIVYSIIIYITSHPVSGWTTTILFLSVAFLGMFGILTIIIKYLQILINLVYKKKHYCYESIEKIK